MSSIYSVVSETHQGAEIITLREADRARAKIAPGLGNNCFEFQNTEPVLEAIAFDQFLAKPTSYGIPVLFPFPNRIRDGRFTFQGQTYAVDPPRHGFVRDKAWQIAATGASDEEGAWLRSRFDANDFADQILSQFPFPFVLEMTYRLREQRLELEFTAQNSGEKDMPVGFGIHPYFQKPAVGGIRVPANRRWELEDSLPTGRLLDVEGKYELRSEVGLEGLQLDDIFTDLIADENGLSQGYIANRESWENIFVEFNAAEFPNVVVYTPPAPRQAVCIEPNTCPTDAFNLEARGIAANVLTLQPGASVNFKISIYSCIA
ncbi:MAG TPA: aldose 1-epimerase [Blastocatellia bacterium]|nr:aldose 1-epimerase [Blastocatellia bacterium]